MLESLIRNACYLFLSLQTLTKFLTTTKKTGDRYSLFVVWWIEKLPVMVVYRTAVTQSEHNQSCNQNKEYDHRHLDVLFIFRSADVRHKCIENISDSSAYGILTDTKKLYPGLGYCRLLSSNLWRHSSR